MVVAAASAAMAQDTKTAVVQNADGSYTVIEYPVGKEVMVTLTPDTTVAGAKGMARIMRSADGTKVHLDLTGVPETTTSYYAYAVDPSGMPTLLGPVTFTNGTAKVDFTTPMNQFMLVLSPNEGLTTVDPNTVIAFRSAVPTGFAVVPRRTTESKVLGVTYPAETTTSPYTVPMLNVAGFGEGERELELKFGEELQGLDAKAYIKNEGGKSKIKMRFGDMRKVPTNKRFVLWAASPDGKYTKLGQVVNTGAKDEAEIRSETSLQNYGLFLTAEDTEVTTPTSKIYSVFSVIPATPKK
jgi:hypothetical protein